MSSLINGTLRYAAGELSALPRAAVVVEESYSQVFKLVASTPCSDRRRSGRVAGPLAGRADRVQPDTGQLAEEWTYRYLGAAHAWASTDAAVLARIGSAAA